MIQHETYGCPAGGAAFACILLHGRDRPAAEIARLAADLARPDLAVICPRAPGGSWYPAPFLSRREENRAALEDSLDLLGAVIDGLAASGLPAPRLVLGGFSQGACVAAEFLVSRPGPYAAALLFSGGLLGPEGTRWEEGGVLPGTRVLLAGSLGDPLVPVWRVEETARVLSGQGAEVRVALAPGAVHQVAPEAARAAGDLLAEAFGPPRSAGARHMVQRRGA